MSSKLPLSRTRSGEAAGYGRPPTGTRFKPGQSGNPKGRPRGSKATLPHNAVLTQLVTIREDGIAKRVPAAEAFLLYLTKQGREGRFSASEQGLQAIEIGKAHRSQSTAGPWEIINVIVSPENANLELLALGMAARHDAFRPTARIMLEPWIVEAALARLGERQLTLVEQATVWNATRTPKKVQWPEWWSVLGPPFGTKTQTA